MASARNAILAFRRKNQMTAAQDTGFPSTVNFPRREHEIAATIRRLQTRHRRPRTTTQSDGGR
jgi:hypothetical protein